MVVLLLVRKVKSTHDTSAVGTRKAMPVSLPLVSGKHRATALAAPVDEGMMLVYALRPPRQSFLEGPSWVGWVAVAACTVVMRPSSRPNSSMMTLTTGAKQLVVHDALETTVCLPPSNVSWLTLYTSVGTSSGLLVGAEIKTRLAPPSRCLEASAKVVKRPVDSMT